MKRCKNCKFWKSAKGTEWGECQIAGSTNTWPDEPKSLAVAYDGEGYAAGLNTHITFGCVQWRSKEDD